MTRLTPRFRALTAWPDEPHPNQTAARFKVDNNTLMRELSDEIMLLQTEDQPDWYVVELVCDENDIRVDGTGLKARADVRYHGVVVSFESAHGPLRFAADRYNHWWYRDAWRANLRAVSAHLEALRTMERHGVAKSGQQYTGWKQLGTGDGRPAGGDMTIVDAMTILESVGKLGDGFFDPRVERLSAQTVDRAYRLASKRAHPDAPGGSMELFHSVQQARAVLARNARPI